MSVDLRGFRYRLEPARRVADWRLNALLVRLGRLQAEIDAVRERLAGFRQDYQERGARLLRWWSTGCDAIHYSRGVQWMARLRGEIDAAEAELGELEAQRKRLSEVCAKQRGRRDAIDAHRGECVADYLREETARQATQADRDWLSRLSLQGRGASVGDDVEPRPGDERVD